jgi:hypothetical protein
MNTVASTLGMMHHLETVKLFNRLELSLYLTLVIMIHQQTIPAPPKLSRRAFWDTEPAALDFSRHASFIITRVFERGTTADQQALLRYYGQKNIIATLESASSLLPIARERAKQLFHLTDEDFACCKSKPQARNFSRY